MTKDMTNGSPVRLILSFSLPILAGNIFQQLYNMVDAVIVGQFISTDALAAVGSTGAISFFVLGFVMGLTSGFSVVIAQRFGAADENGVRKAVAMSVYIGIAMTLLLTLSSVLGTRPLLNLMDTPGDIYADAYAYIVVIFAGTGASVFYNLLSGILRALGDSKTPLYFLIISSVINVILDLVFIIVFHWGVAGAAYATVIAQVVSGLLCLLYMARKFSILRFQRRDWRLDWHLSLLQLKVGLPMAFQFSIIAIGIIILQKAINAFGSSTVAAYTAASKVEQLSTQPLNTLGITMATYCGQNLGAGRLDRIRIGVRRCFQMSIICSLACGALVVFCGRFLVRMFISDADETVMQQAQQYLNTIAVFFIFLGMIYVYRNALQGMGNAIVPTVAGITELVMRAIVALALPVYIGYSAICLASPVAWVGAGVAQCVWYLLLIRRLTRLHPPEDTKREETQ